jgi:integrase
VPKLNKQFLNALKRVTRDTLYRDSALSGFALRVKPSGVATWCIQYRDAQGRTKRLKLGKARKLGETGDQVLTADEARQRARIGFLRIADGRDPSAEKAAARAAITIESLCRQYLADAEKGLLLGKRKRPKAESTIVTDRSRIECHIIPLMGKMTVVDVTPQDVRKFLHAVQQGKSAATIKTRTGQVMQVSGGRGAAVRSAGLLGALFTYAIRAGIRKINPVHGVERPADVRRTAFLTMDDYRALGGALAAAKREGESRLGVDAVGLLALTGCRRGEIMGLSWREVDLDSRQLRFMDTKEGYSIRPLGQAAADLLATCPRHESSELVFASGTAGTPYIGMRYAWDRIAKRAKLRHATMHTLRHSFATTANTLGCSEPTIAAMLGHSRGTVTSRYVHVVDEALLAAADRVSGAIAHALAGGKPAKVVSIGSGRRKVAVR